MRRTLSTIAASALAIAALAACSDDAEEPTAPEGNISDNEPEDDGTEDDDDAEPTEDAPEDDDAGDAGDAPATEDDGDDDAGDAAATEDDEDDATEDEGDEGSDASSGDLTPAAWTGELLTPGEELGVITDGTIEVTIYQAGVAPAPKDGNFVDPDTNEPLIAEGDDLVYVTYLVTNVGDESIPLGSSLVSIGARYIDWPWMQGMDGITDSDLADEMGINTRPIEERAEPTIYELAPGESYTEGENFLHQPGTELVIDVRYTPVDDDGDLVHDDRQEFEDSVTIN